MSAYFEPNLFEERVDESINLLKKSQENKEYFDFGKSINLFSEKYQKSIKNKLKTIENNELKNYIDM